MQLHKFYVFIENTIFIAMNFLNSNIPPVIPAKNVCRVRPHVASMLRRHRIATDTKFVQSDKLKTRKIHGTIFFFDLFLIFFSYILYQNVNFITGNINENAFRQKRSFQFESK